jgi:hypothetical protein
MLTHKDMPGNHGTRRISGATCLRQDYGMAGKKAEMLIA